MAENLHVLKHDPPTLLTPASVLIADVAALVKGLDDPDSRWANQQVADGRQVVVEGVVLRQTFQRRVQGLIRARTAVVTVHEISADLKQDEPDKQATRHQPSILLVGTNNLWVSQLEREVHTD